MEQDLISRIIRTRRRTLALQVTPDASLIVRAPNRASEESIRQAVQRKMTWILKKQRLARETFRPPSGSAFADGETFMLLGEACKLRVVPGAGVPLAFNDNEFLLSGDFLPRARRLFEGWYRKKAFETVSIRIQRYVEMTGLKYAKIGITGARRRWGSCSLKGNLNFSWRLVMTPLAVVDYVIVHELAHLDEHNHSPAFWRKVRAIMPDYPKARQWLRNNQKLFVHDAFGR